MRISLISLLLSGLFLAACGFQLRGDVDMPAVMQKTYVDYRGSVNLQRSIERALLLAGVELADSREQATAVLRLISAPVNRRVLARDEQGRAREYEITVALRYTVQDVDGRALMATQEVRRQINMLLDPTDPLTNRGDIDYQVITMREDSIWEMLRRIAAANPVAPVTDLANDELQDDVDESVYEPGHE